MITRKVIDPRISTRPEPYSFRASTADIYYVNMRSDLVIKLGKSCQGKGNAQAVIDRIDRDPQEKKLWITFIQYLYTTEKIRKINIYREGSEAVDTAKRPDVYNVLLSDILSCTPYELYYKLNGNLIARPVSDKRLRDIAREYGFLPKLNSLESSFVQSKPAATAPVQWDRWSVKPLFFRIYLERSNDKKAYHQAFRLLKYKLDDPQSKLYKFIIGLNAKGVESLTIVAHEEDARSFISRTSIDLSVTVKDFLIHRDRILRDIPSFP